MTILYSVCFVVRRLSESTSQFAVAYIVYTPNAIWLVVIISLVLGLGLKFSITADRMFSSKVIA